MYYVATSTPTTRHDLNSLSPSHTLLYMRTKGRSANLLIAI